MESTSPLNERQLRVLRLVGGGDDLSGEASVEFRNTATALQSRGLVKVGRSGGRWQAVITEAGRFHLDHGAHPEAACASAAADRMPRQRTRPANDASSGSSPRFGPPALKRAERLPPVTVAKRLDRPRPVIARLRDDTERMAMPGEVRHRSLCILHGLAMAAVERGWGVADWPVNLEGCHTEFQQAARYRAGTIEIKLGDFSYEVTVDQKSPKTPDPVKAGRLKLTLPQSHTDLQSTWADAKTVSLEQRLPEVIEALAQRATDDQERAVAAALSRTAQQATHRAAVAHNQARAAENFLAKELDRQARALERWRLLTAYCDQLEAHLQAADPQAAQTESARAWLAWARTHTSTIDPFKELPGMPEVPDDLTLSDKNEMPLSLRFDVGGVAGLPTVDAWKPLRDASSCAARKINLKGFGLHHIGRRGRGNGADRVS